MAGELSCFWNLAPGRMDPQPKKQTFTSPWSVGKAFGLWTLWTDRGTVTPCEDQEEGSRERPCNEATERVLSPWTPTLVGREMGSQKLNDDFLVERNSQDLNSAQLTPNPGPCPPCDFVVLRTTQEQGYGVSCGSLEAQGLLATALPLCVPQFPLPYNGRIGEPGMVVFVRSRRPRDGFQ